MSAKNSKTRFGWNVVVFKKNKHPNDWNMKKGNDHRINNYTTFLFLVMCDQLHSTVTWKNFKLHDIMRYGIESIFFMNSHYVYSLYYFYLKLIVYHKYNLQFYRWCNALRNTLGFNCFRLTLKLMLWDVHGKLEFPPKWWKISNYSLMQVFRKLFLGGLLVLKNSTKLPI